MPLALFEAERPIKIVVIDGATRDPGTCPGQTAKTTKFARHAAAAKPDGVEIDYIDLSVKGDGVIVQPCKGCIGTAGGFHCLPATERVHLANGKFKSIADIRVGDRVAPEGCVTASAITGEKEVFRVHLSDGRELRATADHLIKVIRPLYNQNRKKLKGYDEVWLRVDELEIEDRLPHYLGGSFTAKDTDLVDLFFAAGLVFGDGSISYKPQMSVAFYFEENSPLRDEIERRFSGRYNISNHASGMRRVRFHADVFRPLLAETGLDKNPPVRERRLPMQVMNGSQQEVAAFLDGWFCADGTVLTTQTKHSAIRLDSVSYDALRDAQILLSKLGIRATISDKRHLIQTSFGGGRSRASTLCVEGPQANKFMDLIGLSHADKARKFSRRDYRPGRKRFWGAVRSVVSEGIKPVYDITVDPTHQFLSEGIVVHNCHFPCSCYGPKSGGADLPDLMYDQDVYTKLEKADGFLVFSPVHWYAPSTSVKAFFDRLVCANLTLSIEEASRLTGNDIKNATKTRKLAKSGLHDGLLRNWLAGKTAGFFIHGDFGADDYSGDQPSLPSTVNDKEDRALDQPVRAIKPVVSMVRYSGVEVPDELVVGMILNKGLDYASANDQSLDSAMKASAKLMKQLVSTIRRQRTGTAT